MKHVLLQILKWRHFLSSCEASDKHTEQIRKQLIYFTTLDTLQCSCSAIDIYDTFRERVGFHLIRPPPSRDLCLTLHTHCWLAIPLSVSSTNQGSNYNHTHQIPDHYWATVINKGNALFFKLGFHLKYYIIFLKKEHWQYSINKLCDQDAI